MSSLLLFISTSFAYILFEAWSSTESPSIKSLDSEDCNDARGSDETVLNESLVVRVIMPGLVHITHAIPMAIQIQIVDEVLKHGHSSRKLWKQDLKTNVWELNNLRQGRGRIYDAIDKYGSVSSLLQSLTETLVSRAQVADPTMPSIRITHLLTMYYTTPTKLGWHADNGSQDGSSLQPVVSISLGNECDFLLRKDKSTTPITLRLKSGDVVLFGGDSRWILHKVDTIYAGTAPEELCNTHQTLAKEHAPYPCISGRGEFPDPEHQKPWIPPRDCFRLNLTFRNAPELSGREDEEKFFYFARSARKFLAASQTNGVDQARKDVVQRRQLRAQEKKEKKESLHRLLVPSPVLSTPAKG
jgi:alkylated DNA repair dioxygenase AlkB